ncbi:MAG TPA: nitrilase-related carbon-nitrogen hydrolase, partial [Candidatus Limnocylindrales bacterium]|nr:nitrilase-related carbon-nitrogen hydrolase [Candidatus Limnocylindrales bacterium]
MDGPADLPPRTLRVAGVQMAMGDDPAANLERAVALVREAVANGAELVVLPELFTRPYFPQHAQRPEYLAWAEPIPGPTTDALGALAGELGVAVVGSVYERAMAGLNYNTAIVFGPDGVLVGRTRKAHIPDDPGYAEKYYFAPGDSGYPVHGVRLGVGEGREAWVALGLATCWDQWFPEVARILALKGAELIVYPTAIGSEPEYPTVDTHEAWRTVMRGHAVANAAFVMAVNRVGREGEMTFYGGSFVADPMGVVIAEAGTDVGLLEA